MYLNELTSTVSTHYCKEGNIHMDYLHDYFTTAQIKPTLSIEVFKCVCEQNLSCHEIPNNRNIKNPAS
jgi:hypothetical protein